MTQRYDENLILAYLEGDLTADEKVRFETMLAGDEPLRQLVQSLADDRAALRNLPDEMPPSDLMQPVHDRLERNMLLDNPAADTALPIARHRNRVSRLLAITALAALLMFVVGLVLHIWVFTFNLHDPSAPPGSAPAPGSSAAPGVGPFAASEQLASSTRTNIDQPLAAAPIAAAPFATTPSADLAGQPTPNSEQRIMGTGASESSLASAASSQTDAPQPVLAMKSARSLADTGERGIVADKRDVPAVTSTPSLPIEKPLAQVDSKNETDTAAGVALARETTATLREADPSADVLIQRVQVATHDVKAAQADLREWVITNAIANNTLAARAESSNLRRQRTLALSERESLEQQQPQSTQLPPQSVAPADQLYPQYRAMTPSPITPVPPQTSTANVPRLSTVTDEKPNPVTSITNAQVMNLRLQADQLNSLLAHLNRNQTQQQAKLIDALVTVKKAVEPPPATSPAAPSPAPNTPTAPQLANDTNNPPALIDVIVEFVEPAPTPVPPTPAPGH